MGSCTTVCIDSDQQRQAQIRFPEEGLRSGQTLLETLTTKLEARTKPQQRRHTRNVYH